MQYQQKKTSTEISAYSSIFTHDYIAMSNVRSLVLADSSCTCIHKLCISYDKIKQMLEASIFKHGFSDIIFAISHWLLC